MAGVKIATVFDSIAALVVSGVTIKDVDEIPEAVLVRHCPVMFPDPDSPVSGLRVDPQTTGAGTNGKNNVLYTLNYVYLHTPVGEGRFIAGNISGMVAKCVLILNALIANDAVTGSIDIEPRIEGEFGVMSDATGAQFWGFRIAIDVLEFYEV
jgi:hypothetical protein